MVLATQTGHPNGLSDPEGVDDHLNDGSLPRPQSHPDDVKPARRLRGAQSEQIAAGHVDEPALLPDVDRGDRTTKSVASPGLDLDEHEGVDVLRNEVNLAESGAIPPCKNCVPAPPQLAAGEIFSEFAKRQPGLGHWSCVGVRKGRTGGISVEAGART